MYYEIASVTSIVLQHEFMCTAYFTLLVTFFVKK